MGVDFRDVDNDGWPDISFAALANQTFPLFHNKVGQEFEEITGPSGIRRDSLMRSGFGMGIYDFDNDGWKDLFVSGGHVLSLMTLGSHVDEPNFVFRNPGRAGVWEMLTGKAGFDAVPPARHRGCAFGDLDGDGRIDAVVTAIGRNAEIWMNRSEQTGHWIEVALEGTKSNRDGIGAEVKIVTQNLVQYNHMTTSVGYASSSDGPVHFGLQGDSVVREIDVRWPSGIVQDLHQVPADRILRVKEPAI
jgi:hypothetical protein